MPRTSMSNRVPRRPPLRRGAMAGLLLALLVPWGGAAQETFAEEVEASLNALTSAVSLGLVHQGELSFIQAWGGVWDESRLQPVQATTGSRYAVPELTPVLVAIVLRAMDRRDRLSLHTPLGETLEDLPSGAEEVTIHQLLTHTSGLDNTRLGSGESWEEGVDDLTREALIAPPGSLYSFSHFDYPLAARVLERILDTPLTEILTVAVLEPLGMENSGFRPDDEVLPGQEFLPETGIVQVTEPEGLYGLPVLYTSPADVTQLMTAIVGGALPGMDPAESVPDDIPDVHLGRGFADGFWVDRTFGVPRLFLRTSTPGYWTEIFAFPETRTAAVAMGIGAPPVRVLSRFRALAREMAVPDLRQHLVLDTAGPPRLFPEVPESEWDSWVGVYRNGGDRVDLVRDSTGLRLRMDDESHLMEQDDRGVWMVALPGFRRASVILLDEPSGRYLFLDEVAYWRDPEGAATSPGS